MIVQILFLVGILRARIEVVRSREERDLGASAIEWAIIAAVSVVIAVLVGATVYNVVVDKNQKLIDCAGIEVGKNCPTK